MREVTPGIHHWTVLHERIGQEVSSYFIAEAGAVIDPKVPEGGLDELPAEPKVVLLTSGHHGRDAARFARTYEIPIRASRQAAEHLGDEVGDVEVFDEGDEVADGITAIHIGRLAADEGALLIAVGDGALAIADGINTYSGELAFFPDELLGDDPGRVKIELKDAYSSLLPQEFDHLLFAHGAPVIGGGKDRLREFVTS